MELGRIILDVLHLPRSHHCLLHCIITSWRYPSSYKLNASCCDPSQAGHLGAAKMPLHEKRSEGGPELFGHQSI